MRRLEHKSSISFSAKWKQAQAYARHVIHPLDNLRLHLHKASHILLLDGKFVPILGRSRCLHIAYDTAIGVIDFWLDDTENKTAYGYILRRLKEHDYEPICVVADDHASISDLLKEKGIPHQLCIFHLLKNLRWMVAKPDLFSSDIRPDCKVLYSRIKGIFKTSRIEKLSDRVSQFRRLSHYWQKPVQQKVLRWFWKHLNRAVMGLSFSEKIPKTSNLLENLNGQIEARLKTFRGVKSEKSLENIVKMIFYFRNFK